MKGNCGYAAHSIGLPGAIGGLGDGAHIRPVAIDSVPAFLGSGMAPEIVLEFLLIPEGAGLGSIRCQSVLHPVLPAFEGFPTATFGDGASLPIGFKFPLRISKKGIGVLHHFHPGRGLGKGGGNQKRKYKNG